MDGLIPEYDMTKRPLEMQSEQNINNIVVKHRFRNQWRFIKVLVRRKIILFSLIILIMIIILAIFAPLIAPHDPLQQDLSNSLKNPSSQFLLGTDKFGRDLLSRLIYGSRLSLLISFVAVGVGGSIGTILGIVSGYFGGWIDIIIMRIIDAMLAIPMLILALAFAVVLGQGTFNIILALGIAIIPGFARLVRSVTLSVKQNDYILANRLIGASSIRTMLFHVLPNVMPPLIVHLTISLGHAILAEASLSFLGVGISSNEIAWGSMINVGYPYLINLPLLSIAPGVMVILLTLSLNLVGDGLRDALDPRLRGTL